MSYVRSRQRARAAVSIDGGAVAWSGALETWPWSIDLAPDAMHDELAARGEWVFG
jgi:hypothetical protein